MALFVGSQSPPPPSDSLQPVTVHLEGQPDDEKVLCQHTNLDAIALLAPGKHTSSSTLYPPKCTLLFPFPESLNPLLCTDPEGKA